ncbi:hypothetical protein LTR10_017271 [Elasticomyces elasticus]|uniref:Histone H4 n=1 Tax=Exophiala sideris TaxID=1016849 RepID=A0ABR0JI76_9EURO|nr:hypothetical protein LTR10_017271 [Elasticomyces elasticus]KAK5034169.1 hypothetical protein LTS07_003089 [Exophiala sideris]KAK5042465.1 hypothetical protein LTR13_001312 [Exophiala sideris]KAK5065547.1 hypothetical protein LTR69_003096 [Exophiala sideris]KAK5185995.1 hypothetical protein LTR44_002044 [Eurotiomycetes sp. CCFEE 6388]
MPGPATAQAYGLNRPGAQIPKRHRQRLRRVDAMQGVTRPAIRRLARRGGVIRIQREIYDTIRCVLRKELESIIGKLVSMFGGTDEAKTRPSIPERTRKVRLSLQSKKQSTDNYADSNAR